MLVALHTCQRLVAYPRPSPNLKGESRTPKGENACSSTYWSTLSAISANLKGEPAPPKGEKETAHVSACAYCLHKE